MYTGLGGSHVHGGEGRYSHTDNGRDGERCMMTITVLPGIPISAYFYSVCVQCMYSLE